MIDISTYLSELEEIVNIDSGQDAPEGIAEVAAFFEKRFKAMGWQTRSVDLSPCTGPLLVCANREAEHYDLLLMGHIDTVFPKGTAKERPFRSDGDRAYGPGVFDMKQGSLLIYHILKELPREVADKLNILAVFNPDEEIGSRYSEPHYAEYARRCDRAFIYEGGGNGGARCTERFGRISFKVAFTGKDGHCGYVFTNGARSAISEMARWIVALDSLQSREKETTVNIGLVSGGVGINTVAKNASMTVDIRFARSDARDRIDAVLEELKAGATDREIEAEILDLRYTPALYPTEKDSKYIERASRLLESVGKPLVLRRRGGLSDANKLQKYGVTCIDGMGPVGDYDHTADEYLDIPSVREAYELSMLLITDMAKE